MNNILNLCRVAIAHLNEANKPPFRIEPGKGAGEMFIVSKGGGRIARIWMNGTNDEANAKLILNSLNNCHRFAAALGIAIGALVKIQNPEMNPDSRFLFSGEIAEEALPEIEKCFENEYLNEDFISNTADL